MTQSFPSPNLSMIQMDDTSFFDTPNLFQPKLFRQGHSFSATKDDTNFKTNLKNEASDIISSFLCDDKDKVAPKTIHEGIPIDSINDDNYKAAYINNHIKPCHHNKYWTDTRKVFLMNQQQKSIDERYRLLKTKESISAHKQYHSKIPLYAHNENNSAHALYFDIYNSDSIGVTSNWDLNLKPQLCDNDAETPHLVINQANKENMHYLGEGIHEFTLNKNSVSHYSSR